MKTILGASIIALAMLAGCQQKPDEKLLNACWNAGAKQTVQSIVTDIVSKHIVSAVEAVDSGKHTQAQIQAWTKGRITVTLSNFYLTSADAVAGSVTCGADAAMTFKRLDDKTITADGASFSFAAYRSEGDSSMYIIPSGLALTQMVDGATVADDGKDAESTSQSPASAPVAASDPAEDAAAAASDAAAAASAPAASQ
jgi:hypothetical protein